MTDWLRVIGYTVLGFVILIGLLGLGWIVESRRKLAKFRFTDAQRKVIQDSQRGRRPLWLRDREKNDQSRVDREC